MKGGIIFYHCSSQWIVYVRKLTNVQSRNSDHKKTYGENENIRCVFAACDKYDLNLGMKS